MKIKRYYALLGVATLLTVARVDAATIFAPTDGDVNFLLGDLQGGTLAMFDDSDQTYLGALLNIPVPSIVGIAGPVGGGDHVATNSLSETLTLTSSDNFILGINFGSGWIADSSVVSNGANSFTVSFINGANVLEVDVQVVPPIPVPAAVWLFGSGLIGLVGFMGKCSRRKNQKMEI